MAFPSFWWPWRGQDTSPASFEKTLALLATQIADSQERLDRMRKSSRWTKLLTTLYLTLAYLLAGAVLVLVVGWKQMGALEWTAVAGGPVLIYVVRTILGAYFDFRIDSLESRLKTQQGQRQKTIQKLKEATKYDATMQLLEKYGGADGAGDKDAEKKKAKGREQQPQPQRTAMMPPPTANIQRREGVLPRQGSPLPPQHQQLPPPSMEPTAEFAPNAFQDTPQPAMQPEESSSSQGWFIRLLESLLGEDEVAPEVTPTQPSPRSAVEKETADEEGKVDEEVVNEKETTSEKEAADKKETPQPQEND